MRAAIAAALLGWLLELFSLSPIVTTVTLTSKASPEVIWQAYESPKHWPSVLPDLAEALIAPSGRLERDAVIQTSTEKGSGLVTIYRVQEAERPSRFVITSGAEGLTAETVYAFVPLSGGSRVVVTSQMAADALPGRVWLALWRSHFETQLSDNVRKRTQAILSLAENP